MSPRVLLIDDNLMTAEPLRRALTQAGWTCDVSSAAPADAAGLDRVVINLGSPTIDGPAIVTLLKSARPELPVVGFCGHAETSRRDAARAAGIDRLVSHSALHRDPLVLLTD